MSRYQRWCLSVFILVSAVLFAEKEESYEFQGTHFLGSYSECNYDALTNIEALRAAFLAAAKDCGATVLKSSDYTFPPNGFTMVILLSESHASIHTYPEHQSCFIDLFTCGNHCSFEKFDKALRNYLRPNTVNARVLIRNQGVEEKVTVNG